MYPPSLFLLYSKNRLNEICINGFREIFKYKINGKIEKDIKLTYERGRF